MSQKLTLYLILTLIVNNALSAQEETKNNAKVDYKGFLEISDELIAYRSSRLISMETFNSFSKDSNTIILDTRSKKAFDEIHIKGAVHLNFSDFTTKALADKIASKETRILIYCNNNIESQREALMNKMRPLALNIPTFINLYGYGYKNVYELKDYLAEDDERIKFETTKH